MGTAAAGNVSFRCLFFVVGLRDVPRTVREGTSLSGVPLVYENVPKEAILVLYYIILFILILFIYLLR